MQRSSRVSHWSTLGEVSLYPEKSSSARFNSSVLMLTSLGVAQLIVQWLVTHTTMLVTQALVLVLCAFSHEVRTKQ